MELEGEPTQATIISRERMGGNTSKWLGIQYQLREESLEEGVSRTGNDSHDSEGTARQFRV